MPYALVTHLAAEDVPDFPRDPMHPGAWNSARILYYADDQRADIWTDIALEDSGVGIIWRKVEDPPLWLRGAASHLEAMDAFNVAGRCLDRRGPQEGRSLRESAYDLRLSRRPLDGASAADSIAAQLGFTGRMAEAVHAIVDPIDESPPEPDPDLSFESGYILPDGTFYGCPYMHHSKLAHRLLQHLFNTEVDDPQKEADRRNWLRIQASVTGDFMIMSPKGRPTKRQELTLASWCVKHEVPYPEDLK